MYKSTKCIRCGRGFVTSKNAELCIPCNNRRQNGKRLVAENRERIKEDENIAVEFNRLCGYVLSDNLF